MENIPLSQLLSDPEDSSALAGSSLPRVQQLSLVLFSRASAPRALQPVLHERSRCSSASSLLCHWHWGGTAFNSHFQNQLCHLSWQMAFPVFGLSKAVKVSLPYLQYLILFLVRSYLHKLQCLGLLVFFSCKAISKKKTYYFSQENLYIFKNACS